MKNVIFKDDAAIKIRKENAEMLAKEAGHIAEVWNHQTIMGAMTKKEFMMMLSGGVPYFLEAFHESIRRDEARIKGASYYHLVDVSKYSPAAMPGDVNFDAAKLARIMEAVKALPGERMMSGVDWSLIDFDKNGLPYVPKAAIDFIEDQHTIYQTDENVKALADGQKDAEILNNMIAKGYNITAGDPFEWNGNRFEYNLKCLAYGSGKRPPKDIEVKYSPPAVNFGSFSAYQPSTDINVRRRYQ